MQLAERVGTREIEISRIETGRVVPDRPMKERIADVLAETHLRAVRQLRWRDAKSEYRNPKSEPE